MTAKEAKVATANALGKRIKEAEEELVRRFMEGVWKMVAEAAAKGKTHVVALTTNEIVASLAMEALAENKYEFHKINSHVPENRDYGDSGEGMHEAYTEYVLHISWGDGGCPACAENFRLRR